MSQFSPSAAPGSREQQDNQTGPQQLDPDSMYGRLPVSSGLKAVLFLKEPTGRGVGGGGGMLNGAESKCPSKTGNSLHSGGLLYNIPRLEETRCHVAQSMSGKIMKTENTEYLIRANPY